MQNVKHELVYNICKIQIYYTMMEGVVLLTVQTYRATGSISVYDVSSDTSTHTMGTRIRRKLGSDEVI